MFTQSWPRELATHSEMQMAEPLGSHSAQAGIELSAPEAAARQTLPPGIPSRGRQGLFRESSEDTLAAGRDAKPQSPADLEEAIATVDREQQWPQMEAVSPTARGGPWRSSQANLPLELTLTRL